MEQDTQNPLVAAQDLNARIAFYSASKSETIQRITLRDQALIAYIFAIGSYFGVILGDKSKILGPNLTDFEVAMTVFKIAALPLVSVFFSFVVLQHMLAIHATSKFLKYELFPTITHWDNSISLEAIRISLKYGRSGAQLLIFLIPSLYGFIFAYLKHHGTTADIRFEPYLCWLTVYNVIIVVPLIWLHCKSLWRDPGSFTTDYHHLKEWLKLKLWK